MTYLLWHLGDFYQMVTGSPWTGRVALIILAIFSAIVLLSRLREPKGK